MLLLLYPSVFNESIVVQCYYCIYCLLIDYYCCITGPQTLQLATRMATNPMGQMEPYELDRGEEWATYIERLEQFVVVNKITEGQRKKAVLLTVIGSKAYGLLRNLLSPAKPA